MADVRKEIERKQKRWSSLELERASWFSHWQELARYFAPRSGRFLDGERNRGEKKHNHIYDSGGMLALRTLIAGLMAGMTSPARPWFRLKTPDKKLNEKHDVRVWLSDTTDIMRDVFAASNTYRSLQMIYRQLGLHGTGVNILLPDYENVIHNTPLAIGEFCISSDGRGVVNTLYRKYEMKVVQLIDTFGKENVSTHVRQLYEEGHGYDKWISVIHAIEPRAEREYGKRDAKNMPFSSCYWEANGTPDKYLRESGFKRFPGMAPRWDAESGDDYGTSPGMEALGDGKQLQHQQLRKAQGIDQMTQPSLQAPTSLKGREVQMQPGGVTFADAVGPNGGVRALFETNLSLSELREDIIDVRERINRVFYVDLFLMLANDTRSNITAREIAERHEEKLLMLGPVLERLHNEQLSPLIDVTFDHMIEARMVPPPPRDLAGAELKVEFVSMLAQAQRAVGLASVDRLLGTVGSAAQFGMTNMMDKLDQDQIVDEYADMLGVDPELINANEDVAIIREQRAEQQQAMMAAEAAPAAAQTAKTLSETDTTKKSALTDAVNMFSGYGGA